MQQKGSGPDPLTGLPRYNAFAERLDTLVSQAEKDGSGVAMVLMDVDYFRKLNEDHGTEVGDEVLAHLALHLVDVLGDKGQVFRYGGDAFGIITASGEKEEAFLLAEGARTGFVGRRPVEYDGKKTEIDVTITGGVAAYPDDGATAQEVMRKANEALYRAKVGGHNKVCLAREEKMVTKTTHYTQGQLHGLSRLSKREGMGEAELLREALDDLLRKYNA